MTSTLAQRREWHREHADEVNARRRAARAADPERYAALDRARHERDRAKRNADCADRRATEPIEVRRARGRAWCERNADRHRENCRAYAAANRQRIHELSRAWKRTHREAAANSAALRRARQRGLPTERNDRLAVYLRDDGWCYLCGLAVDPEAFHLDHVVPVVDGGPHLYSNVATTHARCNQAKNRYPASSVTWGRVAA